MGVKGRAAKVWTPSRTGILDNHRPLWKGLEAEVAGLAPAGDVAGQPCPCTVHPRFMNRSLAAPVFVCVISKTISCADSRATAAFRDAKAQS